MRSTTKFMLAMMAMTCAGVIATAAIPTTRPATIPSTQPAGAALRGRVSIDGAWGLQKPDLTRVVVYLASDPALDALPRQLENATVAQKNKSFTPNFLVIPRGTQVEFPNWDNFDHNVFSRSKAAPAFDLERYPRGMSKTRTFEKLGVVQVFCNIHPQMRAVIYVTPNRFFTRADADGNFEITGVPPGTYDVIAWQERCDEQRRTLELRADQPSEISLTLSENRDRALSSASTDRRAYGGVERGLGVKREKLNLPVVTDAHPAPEESRP